VDAAQAAAENADGIVEETVDPNHLAATDEQPDGE
jgi:hypothetical protein